MSSRKIAPPPRRKRVRRTSESSSLIVKGEKTRKRSAQEKSALDNRFHRTFKVTGQASDAMILPEREK